MLFFKSRQLCYSKNFSLTQKLRKSKAMRGNSPLQLVRESCKRTAGGVEPEPVRGVVCVGYPPALLGRETSF